MHHRLFNGAVLFCWLASMGWLVGTKIAPSLVEGDPPDYLAHLESDSTDPDVWRITLKDRLIGHAVSRVTRQADGRAEMRTVVHCDELPLGALTRQLLGVMAGLIQPLFGTGGDTPVELLVATQVLFDTDARPAWISTTVDVGEMRALIRIEGTIDANGKLVMEVLLDSGGGATPLRQTIELPPNMTLSSTLARNRQLSELEVGQRWTVPVYRGFPPNQPMQVLHASVDRREVLIWEGEDVETLVVVYRPDPGSHIQATREPSGREWVRMDGLIVRQEVLFAGIKLIFERIEDSAGSSHTAWLDSPENARLWRPLTRLDSGNGGD